MASKPTTSSRIKRALFTVASCIRAPHVIICEKTAQRPVRLFTSFAWKHIFVRKALTESLVCLQ